MNGLGVILLPGVIPQHDECFRVGDRVRIKLADGTVLESQIDGLPIMHTPRPSGAIVVLLTDLNESDVPIGAEIWSVDREELETGRG